MAVRPFKRSTRQGIPRKNLVARTSTATYDSRNNPIGSVTEEFPLLACTIQPSSGSDLQVLAEGSRDVEAFNIFTNTPIRTLVRGTTELSDEVYIDAPYTPSPGWFTVVRSKSWQVGLIPHYQILVIRKNPT